MEFKYTVKAFFKKILDYKPVFKKTMNTEVYRVLGEASKLRARADRKHIEEVKDLKGDTAEILKKLTRITYEQDYTRPEMYIMHVKFDARLFHDGNMYHQEYIAEDIANRIKYNIISARFITKAREF